MGVRVPTALLRVASRAAAAAFSGALGVVLLTSPARADERPEHDPFEGIERDGRIPGIERPTDIPNPERWRYIPEGRIKPGNLLQRFLVTSFVAPFVVSDKDVGTGFGIAVTDIDFRKKRRREFAGAFLSYSTKGQQSYSVVWQRWLHHRNLAGGGVLQEERSRVRASVAYNKALTKRFFGFGDRTSDSDETSYTDESFEVELGIEHAWPDPGDDLVLSGGLRFEFHDLAPGRKSNVPSTEQIFPAVVAAADDHAQGIIYWGLRYDTRDSQANPYRGWAIGTLIEATLAQSGGDIGANYLFFATGVMPVPSLFHRGGLPGEENPPTDTVAVALRAALSSGSLPFYERPVLGGSDEHRGFIERRFRDKAAWIASAEWRLWIFERGFRIPFTETLRIERVGVAPFYEVGTVAEDGASFFKHPRIHQSYGIGLRLTLERHALFRIDIGFSSEDTVVSAGFGLPF